MSAMLRSAVLLAIMVAVRSQTVTSVSGGGQLSAAGGATIRIAGSMLGSSVNEPPVFLLGETSTLCPISIYTSSVYEWECVVPSFSTAELARAALRPDSDGRYVYLRLRTFVAGIEASCSSSSICRVRVDLHGTPNVTRVATPWLSAGDVLRVHGAGFDISAAQVNQAAKLQRLANGSTPVAESIPCAIATTEGSGAHAEVTSSRFGCMVPSRMLPAVGGFYNASASEWAPGTGNKGRAMMMPSARRVDVATGELYDVELLARISAVSPQLGSTAGGSLLTISGYGFGTSAEEVDVHVGDLSCRVTAVQNTQIQCLLAHAPHGISASAAWRGERGVRLEWWEGSEGEAAIAVLGTSTLGNPTLPPSGSSIVPEFSHGELGSSGGSRLRGWFLAPINGEFSFLVRGVDASAELWWSGNASARRLERLASSSGGSDSAWPSWPLAEEEARASSPRTLVAGEAYYFELLCTRPGSSGTCGTGVRVHGTSLPSFDADPQALQHPSVQHVEQEVEWAQAAGAFADVQHIPLGPYVGTDVQVVLRLDGAGANASTGFRPSASASEVAAAALPLLQYRPCTLQSADSRGLSFDRDSFEDDSPTDLWQSPSPPWSAVTARAVSGEHGEPFCGQRSMFVEAAYALNDFSEAGQSSDGYPLRLFTHMCAAFRVLPGTRAGISLSLTYFAAGELQTLSKVGVELNAKLGRGTYVLGATWPGVVDDGVWRHSCIDLYSQLTASLAARHNGATPSSIFVKSVRLSPLEDDFDGRLEQTCTRGAGMYVDEFYIGSAAVAIERAPPTSYTLHTIVASWEANSTLRLAMTQLGCAGALPLLVADVHTNASATPTDANLLQSVSALRVQSAVCMDGGVSVALSGRSATAYLPWDVDEATAASRLSSLASEATLRVRRTGDGHGAVTVSIKRLDGGSLPNLVVSSSTLSGASVTTSAREIVPYGLDLLPIGGNLLESFSPMPSVRVRVRQQSSAQCAAVHWAGHYEG